MATFDFFLYLGMVVMGVPMTLGAVRYGIAWWKGIVTTVLLTVFGLIGTILIYYVEYGEFGGTSFFGAVFLVPIAFALVSLVLRMPYTRVLDLCTIGLCVTMALLRFNCATKGCCGGRVLFTTAAGVAVRFPSQMTELVVGLSLAALFVYWIYRHPRFHGIIYPWFMVLYGAIRSVLNLLREEWAAWVEHRTDVFPKGMLWSLISLIVGCVWLCLVYRRRKKQAQDNP